MSSGTPEIQDKGEPQQHFRGWFIPVDLLELFWAGSVNAKQVMLLATIDSLVSKGEGCWASNEYLAEKLQVGPRQVRAMVEDLKEKGLIRQTGFDGRYRYLETTWSRLVLAAEERPVRADINVHPARQETSGPPGQKCPEIRQEIRQGKGTSDGLLLGGHKQPEDFAATIARFFYSSLANLRKADKRSRPSAWAKEIRDFINRSGLATEAEFKTVLEWYVEHIDDPKVPRLYTASAFCEHWVWVSDLWKRATGNDVKTPAVDSRKERINLCRRVYQQFKRDNPDAPFDVYIDQKDIDKALIALGHAAGSVTRQEFSEAEAYF